MYKHLFRFLPALLVVILLCGTAMATNLQITVQDSLDNSTISQATIYQEGISVGYTSSTGTFLLTHSGLADLHLRITKGGYDNWEQTVGMNETSLLVNMTRKTLVLKVQLYDSDSFAAISNADVGLTLGNATETKTTDSNGVASFAVMGNTLYDIAITAPNYQRQATRSIEIDADNKNVEYWLLRSDRFSFVVTDPDKNPVQGAGVYIDSQLKGTTDSRGFLVLQIERDKPYVIEVKKDGYESYLERRTIGPDEALMAVQISKVPVGAFVSVYDESRAPVEGAAVYLDNAVSGYTDIYGKYVFGNITAGAYQLEVRKTGYVSVRETITITKQGDQFTIQLPYEQANLTIVVQDKDLKILPGAEVFVNGNATGLTNDNGQVALSVKFNTANNITARKEGYQPASVQNSIIIGNASSTVTLTLERNTDWGFIGLVVLGAACVLLVFALIRHMSNKPRRHIMRRDEI